MRICQATQAFCQDITWENHQSQLVYVPLAAQIVSACSFVLVHRFGNSDLIWGRTDDEESGAKAQARREFVHRKTAWITRSCNSGTMDVIQMLCSICTVAIWIRRIRYTEVDALTRMIEYVLQAYYLLHYFARGMVAGFDWRYPWNPGDMLDLITIAGALTLHTDLTKAPWIDWNYLRVIQISLSFRRIIFEDLSREDMTAFFLHAVMLFLNLIVYIGILTGTIMVFEIYGDPELVEDQSITTNMGELSVVQMIYWVTITVSSVGYGDFVPTTFLSKVFTLFVFLIGIGHCVHELVAFIVLKRKEANGYGEMEAPPKFGNRHLVIVGGGVQESSMLFRSFHREIYTQADAVNSGPRMALMSQLPMPEPLQAVIRSSPFQARSRTHYFIGDPLSEVDGARVRVADAKMVVVMADRCAKNKEKEDRVNLMQALAIKEQRPETNIFLIFLQQESKPVAIRCGLQASDCISLFNISSGLLAQSCLCRGWSTCVLNLLMNHPKESISRVDGTEEEVLNNQSNLGRDDPAGVGTDKRWELEYRRGCHMGIYSFVIDRKFHQMKFSDLAVRMLENGIVPIAVQMKGKVVIAPMSHKLEAFEDEPGEIVFVISDGPESCKSYENKNEFVSSLFLDRQRQASALALIGILAKAMPKGKKSDNDAGVDDDTNDAAIICQQDREEQRSKAVATGAAGGHLVLVMMTSEQWSEVSSFIKVLRCDRLPQIIPIVVVSKLAPTNKVLRDVINHFPDVSVYIGNPTEVAHLGEIGVQQARTVVLLEGRSSSGTLCNDSDTLITLQSVEHFVAAQSPPRHVPVITELFQEESLDYVADLPATLLPKDKITCLQEGVTKPTPFFSHPRFVAGDIFSVNCIGSMLAREYYNPGTTEVVEAMASGMGSGLKGGVPWEVSVPPMFVGRSYGELCEAFLTDLLNAVPVALYRLRVDQSGHGYHYMVTNPPRKTKLEQTDSVVVLAGGTFGRRCYKMGLLKAFYNPEVPPPSYGTTPAYGSGGGAPAEARVSIAKDGEEEVKARMMEKVYSIDETLEATIEVKGAKKSSGSSDKPPLVKE